MNTEELRNEIAFQRDGILREMERIRPTLDKFTNSKTYGLDSHLTMTARLLREAKDKLGAIE